MDKEFARNYYEGIPRRYRADFLKYLVSQLGHSKEYWRSHITGCFELQLPVVIEEAFSRIIHERSWCPPDETTKKYNVPQNLDTCNLAVCDKWATFAAKTNQER